MQKTSFSTSLEKRQGRVSAASKRSTGNVAGNIFALTAKIAAPEASHGFFRGNAKF
jgi:hypothetical protein